MSLPGRSRPNVAVLTRTSPYAVRIADTTGVGTLALSSGGFPSSAPRRPPVIVAGGTASHPAWRALSNTIIVGSPVEVAPGSPLRGTTWLAPALTGRHKKVAAAGGAVAFTLSGRGATHPGGPVLGTAGFALTGTAATTKVAAIVGRLTLQLSARNVAAATGHFTHVLITRDFDLATGAAPTGTVYFTPSAWMVNSGVTVVAAAVPAALDTDGRISISLAANTDDDTLPADSFYTVREAIVGQPSRSYQVIVPHDAGSPIDLLDLPVP